ncbi:MAG: hypothetical protein GF309_15830 [Candidatus Lokiarchaeota archaeon]|nr:hypothetical protein [Candidatus Lokiarchaeota archaeon]
MQGTETTVTVPTSPVQQQTLGFLSMIFIGLVLVLVLVFLARYLKNWKNRPEEPFEPDESRSVLSLLSSKARQRPLLTLGVVAIILIPSIIVVGRTPVHRTNIRHIDPEGDVENPNIDILSVESHLSGSNIVLQMNVAGNIQNDTSYQYKLRIIVKDIDDRLSADYTITYYNGTLGQQYDTSLSVENNTLIVHFPISIFPPDHYMVGLEGVTDSLSPLSETDKTESDWNRTIARLWF